MLNIDRLKKIQENCKILEPLVPAVIDSLGRQSIAFRRHHEQGNVTINDEFTGTNEGNFRTILSYRFRESNIFINFFESLNEKIIF